MSEQTLLALIGSYRKTGNCEIVVKSVAERMPHHTLSLVKLPELNLAPCKGCYACLLPDVQCNLGDDMQWLLDRIDEADAIIVAVPNYVLGPVGILKMAADRSLQAARYYDRFQSKKAAAVLTLGREDYRGYADTALLAQVFALGLAPSLLEIFYGTHPGEVALADDYTEKIDGIAQALTRGNPRPVGLNRCPRCNSDLFRIRPEGIECALCKSLAELKGNALEFHYFHPEFGSGSHEEHMKWLIGKKEEYRSMKDKLKIIQDKYRGGIWLYPEKK